MHRPTLGVLALLFLCGGAIALWLLPQQSQSLVQAWPAAAVRIGAFFGALWLAHPQLQRVPKTVWIGIVLLAFVLSYRPRLLPLAAVFLVVLALLRPRRR